MDFRVNVLVHGLSTGALLSAAFVAAQGGFSVNAWIFGAAGAAMAADGVRGLVNTFREIGEQSK